MIVAMLGYTLEENVLDAVNSVLWIAVVILLEAEVRFPERVSKARHAFAATAALLYGGLAVLVVLWAVNGLWFDAYDALLWLIAFATIELEYHRKRGFSAATAVCALKSPDEAFEIALRQTVDPARGFTSAPALELLAQRARAARALGGCAHAHDEPRASGDQDGMRALGCACARRLPNIPLIRRPTPLRGACTRLPSP